MFGRDPTSDMMPDTLSALSALMLAQAQESIYQKCAHGEFVLNCSVRDFFE